MYQAYHHYPRKVSLMEEAKIAEKAAKRKEARRLEEEEEALGDLTFITL